MPSCIHLSPSSHHPPPIILLHHPPPITLRQSLSSHHFSHHPPPITLLTSPLHHLTSLSPPITFPSPSSHYFSHHPPIVTLHPSPSSHHPPHNTIPCHLVIGVCLFVCCVHVAPSPYSSSHRHHKHHHIDTKSPLVAYQNLVETFCTAKRVQRLFCCDRDENPISVRYCHQRHLQ